MKSLAKRMVAWTLICSLLVTIIVTVVQISFEYSDGIHKIDSVFSHIEKSISPSLGSHINNNDATLVRSTLVSTLNYPDIVRIELIDRHNSNGSLSQVHGPDLDSGTISTEFSIPAETAPLNSTVNEREKEILATVKIIASTHNLMKSILTSTVLTILTQSGKALIMALFFYYFMNVEILIPMSMLSQYIANLKPNQQSKPFKLNRFISNIDDEINQLSEALTSLSESSALAYSQLSQELKEKKDAQSKIAKMAHETGLAEAATGILHDVANLTTGNMLYVEQIKKSVRELPESESKLSLFKSIETLEQRIQFIGKVIRAQQRASLVTSAVERVSIDDAVNDAMILEEWQNKKSKIRIVKVIDPKAHVSINRPQFVAVLVNVLKNARESIQQANRPSGVINITARIADKICEIMICDNGIGIENSTVKKVFTRGFTSKKDGHGFGLAAGSAFITSSGGTISITSDGLDKGATIRIQLPVENSVETGQEEIENFRQSA